MRYRELFENADERLAAIKRRRAEIDLRAAALKLRREEIEARVAAEVAGGQGSDPFSPAPAAHDVAGDRERREREIANRPINRLMAQLEKFDADPRWGHAGRRKKT